VQTPYDTAGGYDGERNRDAPFLYSTRMWQSTLSHTRLSSSLSQTRLFSIKRYQISKNKTPLRVEAAFLRKELAATYSRGSYTSTTIGKAAFDGRVRDGIGSDHSFMATNKIG
jgi:hypothetical protein